MDIKNNRLSDLVAAPYGYYRRAMEQEIIDYGCVCADGKDGLVDPEGEMVAVLGEPEDRTWSRDGDDAVKELTRQFTGKMFFAERAQILVNALDDYFGGCFPDSLVVAVYGVNEALNAMEEGLV